MQKNVPTGVYVGVCGRVYGVYEIRCCLEDHRKSGRQTGEKLNKTEKIASHLEHMFAFIRE